MNLNHFRRVRQLYKAILKMHNGLPEHIKAIGNGYVKEEFKRHKNCNAKETAIFLEEWTVKKKFISLTSSKSHNKVI